MRRFWFTKFQLLVLVLGSLTVGSLANYVALSALPAPVAAQEEKAKPKYFKGRVAPKNLAHLRAVSHAQHGRHLKRMKQTLTPPSNWDSRTKGWVPPVQDQQQCGSCFKGDAMIRMADGTYRRIDKVCVGDEVISAEGNVCRVTATMKRPVNERLAQIKIAGSTILEATHEHPILTMDGYCPIGDLRVGQFVAIPRYLPNSERRVEVRGQLARPSVNSSVFFPFGESVDEEVASIPLTYGLGRLMGLFVAEGTAVGVDRKVLWSLNITEADSLGKEIVERCWEELGVEASITLKPETSGCKVAFGSASLARQFYSWFGSGPSHKTIPGCFMAANKQFLRGLLSGWIDGDRQKKESAVTVSSILALQMRDVANNLGFLPALSIHTQPKTDSRGVEHLLSWRVALNDPEKYKRGVAKQTDTHLWRKVTAVGEGEFYSGNVYNLEVERDHSYTVNGIGVHNCWDFSGTGVVDIAYMVAGMGTPGQNWLFSEQYTLSCGSNGGCNGDDNTTVLKWAKDTGLPLQAVYGPYTASSGRCSWTSAETLYKISDWGFADSSGGDGVTPAADIKSAIMQYGCVGAAVAADDSFSNYSGGVFDRNTSSSIDHDIILCGWDDSKSKTPGKTVWLLRNSWNTSWGESGYMWIGEGVNLVGTEAVWAVVSNPTPPAPPAPPGPQPEPPFLNKTQIGNGWSGQLTFEGGVLTNVTPIAKPRKEGRLPSYRPELVVKP